MRKCPEKKRRKENVLSIDLRASPQVKRLGGNLRQLPLEVSRFLKNATPTPGDSCEKVDLTRLLAIPLKASVQPYR